MAKRLVGIALIAVFVLCGGNTSGAGEVSVGGTMDVSPTTVKPGEIVTASNAEGSECVGAIVIGNFTARPGAWSTVPDENGDWSVDLEVPANGAPTAMGEPTPFPPGEYEIFARCEATCPEGWEAQCGEPPAEASSIRFARSAAVPSQVASFDYEPVTIEVVADEPTPPTTEGAPTTSTPGPDPTVADDGAVQPSGAAAPVTAQPTFTG